MRKARIERAQSYFKKLNELYSFQLNFDEFCVDNKINMKTFTSEASIGRPLIAKYLMKKNLIKSVAEAFDVYLSDKSPAYQPLPKTSMEKMI